MNKSLHATLISTRRGDPLSLLPLLEHTIMPHCWNPLFGLHKCSVSISECQWMQFFPRGGIQCHIFASSALPCQTPYCQSAPLLPSVTWQQNGVEYWWECSASTAISPSSTADVMGQHNKIWGITFRAGLIDYIYLGEITKCHVCRPTRKA